MTSVSGVWGRVKVDGERFLDRIVLASLNFVAGYVTSRYTRGVELPFPELFIWTHYAAGFALLASIRSSRWTPWAFALSAGVFTGRALNIWLALGFDNQPFPRPTLVLAGFQWAVLAWVIRPKHVVRPTVDDIQEIAAQLDAREGR